MAQGRKKQNVRLENALDMEVVEALESAREEVSKARKATQDKPTLEGLAKKYARISLVIKRVNTRIANRTAGPKETIDLEDLI